MQEQYVRHAHCELIETRVLVARVRGFHGQAATGVLDDGE